MTFRHSSSIFEESLNKQHQQDARYRITLELGVFILLLFSFFMVGVNTLHYNTIFLDEAINAVVGEDLLQGVYSRNALAFLFGSYLYPLLSALLDNAGGVAALRLASVVLMCLASVFVYLTTRIYFGNRTGLVAMMLFSFSGSILNLGQLAVYDSLALPFLSASLFLLVAATKSERHQKILFLASSVCVMFSIASKYIGLIYLPALFLTALVLLGLKGMPLRQALFTLFIYFVLPIQQVLSFYAARYWPELVQVFQGQGFSLVPRWLILKIIGQEIGMIVFLALAGTFLLGIAVTSGRNQNSQVLYWDDQSRLHWASLPRSYRAVLAFIFLLLLFSTWLAAPMHHWVIANGRSLWKNCAYSLIFLAPLAGYCIATVVRNLRSRTLTANMVGLLFLCASLLYFTDKSLDSNWSFHQSWPNTQGVMNYLQDSGLNEKSRILAEGMDIYEYYFAFGVDDRAVWNSFWYMEYGGASGQEGALNAIRDRALDFIIIDDYYFPGIRERVAPLLAEAGYVVGWQEEQELRTGEKILLQVFIPGTGRAP